MEVDLGGDEAAADVGGEVGEDFGGDGSGEIVHCGEEEGEVGADLACEGGG